MLLLISHLCLSRARSTTAHDRTNFTYKQTTKYGLSKRNNNSTLHNEVGWIITFNASDTRVKERNYFPSNPTRVIPDLSFGYFVQRISRNRELSLNIDGNIIGGSTRERKTRLNLFANFRRTKVLRDA